MYPDDERREDDEELTLRDLWYGARAGGMLASAFLNEAAGAAWSAATDASQEAPVEEAESSDESTPEPTDEGDVFYLSQTPENEATPEEFEELDEGDVFYLNQEHNEEDEP